MRERVADRHLLDTMQRRFSAADLEDVRKWEFRQNNAKNGDAGFAKSMLDCPDDGEVEPEPAVVHIAVDISKVVGAV